MWLFKKKDGRSRAKEPEEIDEIITKGAITRLKNQRLKMLQQEMEFLNNKLEERQLIEQIEEIRQDLEGDYEDDQINTSQSFEEQFMGAVLGPILAKNQAQQTPVPQQSQSKVNLTDEQLLEHKQSIPENTLKMIKTLDQPAQMNLIKSTYPQLDEDTVLRAVELLN